jgi:hypothetical protein
MTDPPGTNVLILKIFSPKNGENFEDLTIKATIYAQKIRSILIMKQIAVYIFDPKTPKRVTITLTPEPFCLLMRWSQIRRLRFYVSFYVCT